MKGVLRGAEGSWLGGRWRDDFLRRDWTKEKLMKLDLN